MVRLIRRLFRGRRRPRLRQHHATIVCGDREGGAWVRSASLYREGDVHLPRRVARRLRLASGDRVLFDLDRAGRARRVMRAET